MNTYYMLNASNGLIPLILTASPRGRYYSYPRFIDEETIREAKAGA